MTYRSETMDEHVQAFPQVLMEERLHNEKAM
jgi:hypothetical protein